MQSALLAPPLRSTLDTRGPEFQENRDAMLEKLEQIDRLLVLALERLDATKTVHTPRKGKTTMFLIALGVSGAMILTALSLLFRVM